MATQTKKSKIISYIKWRINSGVYKPNGQLHSENALSIKFNCSRLTARAALQQLKAEKYIISRKGRGYFVSLGRTKLEFKSSSAKSDSQKFQVVDLPITQELIEKFKTLKFDIEKNIKDYQFSFIKTYFSKNEPYTVLLSYLNTEVLGSIEVEEIKDSVSAYLGERGINISKREEVTFMSHPTEPVRLRLKVPKNSIVGVTYSIMKHEKKGVIEFAVRYTIPSEFILKKIKTY